MAYMPCSRGPHFNPTRNHNFYVSRGAGNDFERYLLRLCDAHTAVVQEDLAQYEVSLIQTAGGVGGVFSDCLACGQPIRELGEQLFITGYPAKDEREDYWARVHEQCSTPASISVGDELFGAKVETVTPVPRVPLAGTAPPAKPRRAA